MGRIKTFLVKDIAKRIFEEHENEFVEDFEKNKEIMTKYIDIKSKKMRNIIAGYITKLKRRNE